MWIFCSDKRRMKMEKSIRRYDAKSPLTPCNLCCGQVSATHHLARVSLSAPTPSSTAACLAPWALGSGHSRAPCLGLPPPPRGLVLSSSVAPLLLAGFWASLSLRRCLPIRWDYIKSVEVFSRRVLHQQSQSIYTKRVKMSLVVQEQGSFQHILRYVSIS